MKLHLQITCYFLFAYMLFANAQTETIKIYYMGSSSFSDELATTTCNIAEASGDFIVEKTRGGGYFRLDYMASDSMQYVDWVNTYMPDISAGQYDYVIMQTLGWGSKNPETMDWFIDWMMNDMMQRIKATGAEPVFYQKYGSEAGCYPDPIYYNALLHLRTGVTCNIDKITFAEGSMFELRDIPYFQSMRFLMDGTGHPGEMANYVTACVLSYLMTGVDPRGNSIRSLPLQGWAYDDWVALPASDPLKSRVVDGNLILTEWEADTLQRIAMHWHLPWAERLAENMADGNVYSATRDEMLLFELDYGNYADRGYAQHDIDRLDAACDQSFNNILSPAEIEAIKTNTKQFSQRIQDAANLYLSVDEIAQLQKEYDAYWYTNNVKLRDDVYFFSLVAQAIAEKDIDTDEISRLTAENEMLLEILSQAAENILLEKMSPAERTQYFSTYAWSTPLNDYTPQFGQLQLVATGDIHQLMFMREMYFSVWENPNLMDELKATKYSQDVWLYSDTLFMKDWNELMILNAAGTYKLIVVNGTGDGEYSSGESVSISALAASLGYIFDAWTGNTTGVIDANASSTMITMPASNVILSASYKAAGAIVSFLNASFETPDVASYTYAPAGSSWSWNSRAGSVGSGITDNNGTVWTGSPIELFAPDGQQACLIQTTGWISQDVDFPSGTYLISFKAAQRPVWQSTEQTIRVLVGAEVVGTFTPTTNNEYLEYMTSAFIANSLTTIRFEGTNPNGGDNTALIDDVKIYAAPPSDSENPTEPSNLASSSITYNSFSLSWTASTDNIGVAKYEIYKNDVKVGETFSTSYNLYGLSGSTSYAIKVLAKDAAGNASDFSLTLDVTTSATPALFTLTVNSGSGDGNYPEAAVIPISANSPATGKAFDTWTGDITHVDDVNASSTSITMPASAVELTATYLDLECTISFNVTDGTIPIQDAAVTFNSTTVNTNASGDAVFSNVVYGTGLGYSVSKTGYNSASASLDATSNLTENVIISVASTPTYTVSIINGTGSGDYEEGTTVNIEADTAPIGQEFDAWTGDISLLSSATATATSFTMPANAVSLTATYKDIEIIDAVNDNELILKVYPNPASNFVMISSNTTIETIQILSITGSEVLERTLNQQQSPVNISQIPSGVYFMKLKMEDNTHQIIRIIKE